MRKRFVGKFVYLDKERERDETLTILIYVIVLTWASSRSSHNHGVGLPCFPFIIIKFDLFTFCWTIKK